MRLRKLPRYGGNDALLTRVLDTWGGILNAAFEGIPPYPAFVVTIPVPALASVADGDVVARFTPGHLGRLKAVSFFVTTAVTTASRFATFTPRISNSVVTGGVVRVTSALATPKGASIEGSTVTGGNVFTDTQEITVVAETSAAFAEGAGVLVLVFG